MNAMTDDTYLEWPFFEERHRELARRLEGWAAANIPRTHGADVDAQCRALVKSLGGAGWLRLDEVKPAGKRAMGGDDWANGLRGLGDVRLPS